MQRRCPTAANVTKPNPAAGVCTVVSNPFSLSWAMPPGSLRVRTCFCTALSITPPCAAQVALNALRRHQQEGRASGTRVQVEASSVGARPDRMLGWGRGQREGPPRGLESARRSRSSCGGSARAGGSLCWADDYKRGRRRRWQRSKLVWQTHLDLVWVACEFGRTIPPSRM
jgi:hypothetical protein